MYERKNRYDAQGFQAEAEFYWNVENHTGKYPDLEALYDAGKKSELSVEIGNRYFRPDTTFEDLLR